MQNTVFPALPYSSCSVTQQYSKFDQFRKCNNKIHMAMSQEHRIQYPYLMHLHAQEHTDKQDNVNLLNQLHPLISATIYLCFIKIAYCIPSVHPHFPSLTMSLM